jgi:hypothetical protein
MIEEAPLAHSWRRVAKSSPLFAMTPIGTGLRDYDGCRSVDALKRQGAPAHCIRVLHVAGQLHFLMRVTSSIFFDKRSSNTLGQQPR